MSCCRLTPIPLSLTTEPLSSELLVPTETDLLCPESVFLGLGDLGDLDRGGLLDLGDLQRVSSDVELATETSDRLCPESVFLGLGDLGDMDLGGLLDLGDLQRESSDVELPTETSDRLCPESVFLGLGDLGDMDRGGLLDLGDLSRLCFSRDSRRPDSSEIRLESAIVSKFGSSSSKLRLLSR